MVIKLGSKNLQLAPMIRIMRAAGAQRVSEESAEALRDALENIGLKISTEAIDFMRHAGRKTIKARDIEIAVKKFLE